MQGFSKLFIIFYLIIISKIGFFTLAHSAEAFKFKCNDTKTVGFRIDTANGQIIGKGWGEESFGSSWTFEYLGYGEEVFIQDKPNYAFINKGTVVILEYAANAISQSLWTYAINLKMDTVVATQVNAAVGLGMSNIKSRVVELECRRLK